MRVCALRLFIKTSRVIVAPMHQALLSKFNITEAALLGVGGESRVYQLPEGKMLRLYKDQSQKRSYLELLSAFYKGIEGKFSFQTPVIYEIQESDGVLFSIAKCIEGNDMSKVLPTLNPSDKKKLFQNYFDAMEEIHSVSFPESKPYGQILVENPITASTWPEFLRATIRERAAESAKSLHRDVPDFPEMVERLIEQVSMFQENPPKELVHGDFFPHNILINDTLDIVGVIDMSSLTVVGDHMMDVVTSYIFLETAHSYKPEDSEILWPIIEKSYGPTLKKTADFYRAYAAVYFGDAASNDAATYPALYPWCVEQLLHYRNKLAQ